MATEMLQILFWLLMVVMIVVLSARLVRQMNRQADDLDVGLDESFERQRRRQAAEALYEGAHFEPSYARERFSRDEERPAKPDRAA